MPDASGFTLTDAEPAPSLAILTRTRQTPPALQLDAFGPFWAGWVAQAAEGANAPPDYVALPLLALASALVGNARWAQAWRGWEEPPVLWCASVGNPSSGKSSGASPVIRDVLNRVETRISRDFPAETERWHERESVARAVLRQWEKDVAKAVKNDEPVPPKPDAATIPVKPIRPRASVSDITVQKLALILEGAPKGVLNSRDELAGWLLNLSRYSNGGTDRPFWLEAYMGGPHQVDRVKREEPVLIPHLSCAVFGTIQPDRLADVLTGADDGLASRFLWCWPEARLFEQPGRAGDVLAAADKLERLAALGMVKEADGRNRPSILALDPEAVPVLAEFGREMQVRENDAQNLMKSALGKARGQALRLALVLTYLKWCANDAIEPATISAEAMEAAVDLVRGYFLPMALRVLGDAAVPEEERNARTLAHWIARTRPNTVNISAIRDEARLPGLRESEPVKTACRFLADARWLLDAPKPEGRGRPRGDYVINPRLWMALDAVAAGSRLEGSSRSENPEKGDKCLPGGGTADFSPLSDFSGPDPAENRISMPPARDTGQTSGKVSP